MIAGSCEFTDRNNIVEIITITCGNVQEICTALTFRSENLMERDHSEELDVEWILRK